MYTTNYQRLADNLCETVRLVSLIDTGVAATRNDLTSIINVSGLSITVEAIKVYDNDGLGKGNICMLLTEQTTKSRLIVSSGSVGYIALSDALFNLSNNTPSQVYNCLATIRMSQSLLRRHTGTTILGHSMNQLNDIIMQLLIVTAKDAIYWTKHERGYTTEFDGNYVSIDTVSLEGHEDRQLYFAYNLSLPGYSALLCAGTPAYYVITDLFSVIDGDFSAEREKGMQAIEQLCNMLIDKVTDM